MNWKIALVLCALGTALGSTTEGCVNDDCDQADNHVSDCALIPLVQGAPSGMTMAQNCNGVRLCQSHCISQASCADINASQCVNQISCNQIPGQPLSLLEKCLIACQVGDAGTGGGPSDGG